MTLNGYVPLVRGDRESVMTMLDHCRRLLRNGSAVMIFPAACVVLNQASRLNEVGSVCWVPK